MAKKVALSRKRREQYKKNAEIIKFLRRNPIIACEELLGIQLIDSQKWILQQSWNTPNNIWTCSRSFGKSFMLCVFIMLKLLLYPNIKIYLLSSKGNQAQETFLKLEDMAKQRLESIPSLKDIFINEVSTSKNSDGFVHDKASFKVEVLGGGKAFTLNSIPDNVRGKRANLLVYDESAFCTDELIEVTLPFVAQDSDFKLSTDEDFDADLIKKAVPNQVIFASSASDWDTRHAKEYRKYGMKMIMGDNNYFSADIPCDIPLAPMVNGVPTKPLLNKKTIDDEMRLNPDKAKREYYNKFQADGGSSQIIKWANIRGNETFDFPQMASENDDERFILAFDPAHGSNDNSVIGIMKVTRDGEKGWHGEIVNVITLLDLEKRTKRMLKFTDQEQILRETLVAYSSGAKLYYEGIEKVYIDAGAGGHGTSYADNLLEDWTDDNGITRRGIIDKTYDKYEEEIKKFPNAKDIVRLRNPQKYKKQMIEEMISVVKSDLVKFPREYNGKSEISYEIEHRTGKYRNITDEDGKPIKDKDGKHMKEEIVEVEVKYRPLSVEEQMALVNIDIMKSETTSIHEIGGQYKLPPEKAKIMNDDRFDVLVMLCHGLYQMRRNDKLAKPKKKYSYGDYFMSSQ